MPKPLKIGIDVWRKEFVNWNLNQVFQYDQPTVHSVVESFYEYLENKNKNNKAELNVVTPLNFKK